jgi:RsiW-degrading membrane proteinase PrsW (M82 family)
MFSGWRARLHYWSRHRRALKKTAVGIVVISFISAWLLIQLFPKTEGISLDPVEQQARNEWQRLRNAPSPQPRELARWLRGTLRMLPHLCDAAGVDYTTWATYQQNGKLVDYEVRGLIQRHAAGHAEGVTMFEDFIMAQLLRDEAPGPEAYARIQERAQRAAPPPIANELYAAILQRQDDNYGALAALLREATLFADTALVRQQALRIALHLKDTESVRKIRAMPGWLDAMPPLLQHQVGVQLQDPWLQWHGLLQDHLINLPFGAALLTLFVTLLWYVIFVLHSAPRRWRWVLPIPPLIAGILSVWPTLTIIAWEEVHWNMTEDAPFPYDLWYWIAGVGLREEVAKLALFALFLPWLLRRRQPGLALITGAFVGLGFAMEENLQYYQEHGFAVAVARFLSANFLHAAMTGIAGHALYDLLRSRFAHAEKFIGTFLAVVTVHGVYDYAAGAEGLPYVSMILLAFLAWYFLDLIEHEAPPARQIISPAAVLLLGAATLIAVVFLVTAIQEKSVAVLADAAEQSLGILPMAVIYWRRL